MSNTNDEQRSIVIHPPTTNRRRYFRSYEVRLSVEYEDTEFRDILVGRVMYHIDQRKFWWYIEVDRTTKDHSYEKQYVGTVHDPRRYDHYVDAFSMLDRTIKNLEVNDQDWWTIDNARWT